MSGARIFDAENRLAKVLVALGGSTSKELVEAADERVHDLEGAICGYVEEKLKLINDFAEQGDDVLFAECRELGQHALHISEVAGAAGLTAVGEIARGISSMVENLLTSGVWHTDALRVHLNTIALLAQRGGEAGDDEEVILTRLRGMRSAIGVVE